MRRGDTNHGERASIKKNDSPQNIRNRIELRVPKLIADDCNRVRCRTGAFLWRQEPAYFGPIQSIYREKVARNQERANRRRLRTAKHRTHLMPGSEFAQGTSAFILPIVLKRNGTWLSELKRWLRIVSEEAHEVAGIFLHGWSQPDRVY